MFLGNDPNRKYNKIPPIFPDRGPYGLCGISGCGKINLVPYIVNDTILIISFLSFNIERQMSYQIATLPEFYKMEFQNQLSWLPGCHGNQILASISVAIATTIISIT